MLLDSHGRLLTIFLLALTDKDRKAVLVWNTPCPEKHLHHSILRWHHQTYIPKTTLRNSWTEPGGMAYDIVSQGDFQSLLKDKLEQLLSFRRGFYFTLDIVLQHVWLLLTGSVSLVIHAVPTEVDPSLLVLLERWDLFAYKHAHAFVHTSDFFHLNEYACLRTQWDSQEDIATSPSLGVSDLLDIVRMLELPRPSNLHIKHPLPKTTAYLQTAVRRAILWRLVGKCTGRRLPVELQEMVLGEILTTKKPPKTVPMKDKRLPGYNPFEPFRPANWQYGTIAPLAQSHGDLCRISVCCCRHRHVGGVIVRRWDAAKRDYVPAHRNDPGVRWAVCGLEITNDDA